MPAPPAPPARSAPPAQIEETPRAQSWPRESPETEREPFVGEDDSVTRLCPGEREGGVEGRAVRLLKATEGGLVNLAGSAGAHT